MATITIPDDLKAEAETRAAEGGYATVEEYVAAVLRADAAAHGEPELEAVLLERLGGGPGVELTTRFIEQFRRDVEQRRAFSAGGGGRQP